MVHEKSLREQRLRFEIQQAKKETNFYLEMVEKRKKRKLNEDNFLERSNYIKSKQRETDEMIRKSKNEAIEGVDVNLLERIFS
jgi:hypothetical protein